MKVKRFFASDMRQAIQKVREDQGPEAVILSNRQVDGGIEIIAAIDYDENLFEQTSTQAAPASADDTPLATETPPLQPTPQVSWSQDPAIVSMRDEISQLRGLLENELAQLAWNDRKRRQPLHADVMRRLSSMELHADLIERVSAPAVHARDDVHALQLSLTELANTVPVVANDFIDQGGIVALVGCTGVGKTTSVAKLAARFVLRHGQRHVALVTTDSYRIGAHEQLMTYGRLLGISVQVASDHKELGSILNSLSDKRLVLIDTAGMSQRDVRLTEQFSTLADAGIPIRTLLVLSATLHPSVLDETIRAFSSVNIEGAILTKLDEAASLGGALSTFIKQALPLMFVTNGQRVPEDLHPARADKLVQMAIKLSDSSGMPDETIMAQQFGGFQTNVSV